MTMFFQPLRGSPNLYSSSEAENPIVPPLCGKTTRALYIDAAECGKCCKQSVKSTRRVRVAVV